MQENATYKFYLPVLYLFISLSVVFISLRYALGTEPVDFRVLQMGNIILLVVGLLSVGMSVRAMEHRNVQVFLRLVYGSFLLKFFVLAIAAFIYIYMFKKEVNKPGLLGCCGLYLLYTFIELRTVMKKHKKPNA